MASHRPPHVPKFGNWDANDPMPYTVVFNHARAGKGKISNPNDLAENQDALVEGSSPLACNSPGRFAEADGTCLSDLQQERVVSEEDGDSHLQLDKISNNSYGDSHVCGEPDAYPIEPESTAIPQRTSRDLPLRKLGCRDSGSDNSHGDSVVQCQAFDQSSVHSISTNPRASKPGSASPAWENRRKASIEEGLTFSPSTPARSRLRAGMGRADEVLEKAALPKFGAWDAKDPTSGDGFTVIFNNARNEKKSGGPVRIPQLQPEFPNQSSEDLYKPPITQKANRKWYCCCRPAVKT